MPTGRAHTCGDVIGPWAFPTILGGYRQSGGSSALHTHHNNILTQNTGIAQGSPGGGTMWHDGGTCVPIWSEMARLAYTCQYG